MKWKKLGKIFDPTEHDLPIGNGEFAQSPQTIIFDNFIRIYFSTRERDHSGKYLSHVCFVDMSKDFKNVLAISPSSVIELGGLGDFDEHGIFPMNVLKDKKHSRILAYTTGWNRRVSVSVDASVGLAVSNDNGMTFQKVGKGPVLTSSLHEPFLVGDAFVSIYGDTYHMWYIYGTKWIKSAESSHPDRVYKIGHATSEDGKEWEKEGKQIIADKLNPDECQALPTVIEHDNRYHMFFCYRQPFDFRKNKENSYRIGYAYSDDLLNWNRDDLSAGITVSESGWDSEMLAYPHVFECDGNVYMLYNGNEFGRFGFGVALLEC
ncbi:hypothetical protein [Alkalimarinus coralli]|uniref:hypothetical protein n=1 Tax=Alkalimarinus coralli TaxID=2935863 RepID=UPI00202B534B|nr:hypothetical protein [Alkalimarinus coralli]